MYYLHKLANYLNNLVEKIEIFTSNKASVQLFRKHQLDLWLYETCALLKKINLRSPDHEYLE